MPYKLQPIENDERREPKLKNVLICGARARSTGKPCRGIAVGQGAGNGRCRVHGGLNPQGVRQPSFETGRYSKIMPKRLLDRYQEAMRDRDLLSLRDEVMLIDARLSDVLKRVDSGEAEYLWKEARNTLRNYRKAVRAKDVDEAQACMKSLEEIVDRGLGDYAAWHDVRVLVQERRKLVESERKRLIEMQQTITSDQAMAFVAAIISSVKRNVADPVITEAISRDIARLIGARPLPSGRTIEGRVIEPQDVTPVEAMS